MDYREFVAFATQSFTSAQSFLPIGQIADIGRKEGVLTAEEAIRLEGQGQMPGRLVELFSQPDSSPRRVAMEPDVVIAGQLQHLLQPTRLLDSELPRAFNEVEGRSPSVKVFHGTGARIITQNYMNATIVDAGFVPELSSEKGAWAWHFFDNKPVKHLRGKTLVMIVAGSSLPSHWFFDTLPRLILAKTFTEWDRFDQILVAAKDAPFHREAFDRLGLDPSRVIARPHTGPIVQCDEFSSITDVRAGFFGGNWLYQSIVNCFSERHSAHVGERLYISRFKASRRRILNEDEVLKVFQEFGFKTIFAEDLSVAEIAGIMATATHVVGPHGAGLSNVVFCRPGAKVMEIYNTHISTEFWKICGVRQLSYYVLQAEGASGEKITETEKERLTFKAKNGSDMIVKPDKLREALSIFVRS